MKTPFCAAALVLFAIAPFAAHAAPCTTTTDENDPIPLLFSARTGDTQNVRCLLDEGADANVADSAGVTALMRAARFGHTDTARLLIERGADPNIATRRNGATALMIAAYQGHADMVRLLLAQGANPNARNDNGKTPLAFALRGRDGNANPAIVQILRAAGAPASVMQWIEYAVFNFLSNFSDTSVLGLIIFVAAVLGTLFVSDMIFDPKKSIRSALDFYHKRISKQDPGWLDAKVYFIELCIIVFTGTAGLFLFLTGLFVP